MNLYTIRSICDVEFSTKSFNSKIMARQMLYLRIYISVIAILWPILCCIFGDYCEVEIEGVADAQMQLTSDATSSREWMRFVETRQ